MNETDMPSTAQPRLGWGEPSPVHEHLRYLDCRPRTDALLRPMVGSFDHPAPASDTPWHDDVPHDHRNTSGIASIGTVLLLSLLLWMAIAAVGWWLLR